jgi:hypothetical protein
MSDLWEQCRRAALADGPAPALRLLDSSVGEDAVACGPGGHAVCATDRLHSCDWIWSDGVRVERRACAERVLKVFDVAGEEFTAVHVRPPDGVALTGAGLCWLTGLAWLHLGVSERLLRNTARYLGARDDGDGPLLQRSVLQSELADAQLELLQARANLGGADAGTLDAPDTAGLALVHAQLGTAARGLRRMLGASGFLAERPGQEAYLVDLLTDVHVAPTW